MSNDIKHELPSLTPDRDQVRAYKDIRAKAQTEKQSNSNNEPSNNETEKSGGSSLTIVLLLIIIALSALWFYQQDVKTQELLTSSEKRIQDLENQLSATGEEMGESAVAMKVRLEVLSKQSTELWEQMDKLWASAWRRNQADIEKLNTQLKTQIANSSNQIKQIKSNAATLKIIDQKQTETEFSVGILSEQVQAAEQLKSQLEEIKNNLSSLQSNSLVQDNQQIELASNLSDLLERIKRLESKAAVVVPQ